MLCGVLYGGSGFYRMIFWLWGHTIGDRLHTASWREQRKARASENFHRWGLRRKPKTALYTELRLQGAGPESVQKSSVTKSAASCGTPSLKRMRLEFEEDLDREEIGIANDEDLMAPPRKKLCNRPWKLLQFDKSHRPAYYGTFSKQRFDTATLILWTCIVVLSILANN